MKLKNEYITQTKKSRLYNVDIPIIGLTGGIATGKSSVSQILQEQDIPVLCADKLVKEIYQKKETKDFIKQAFPQAINNNDIDFKKLREVAFSNKENRETLEKYIYTYLPEVFLSNLKNLNDPQVLIYDVPLLFEKGLAPKVDLKVCVYAPKKMQIERLMKRDNINESLAKSILSQQMDIEEKKKNCDLVIDNSKDLPHLEAEIQKFIGKGFEHAEC